MFLHSSSIFSDIYPVTTTISVIPYSCNNAMLYSSSFIPFTSTNDFGLSLVSCPNLLPLPAAIIIACIFSPSTYIDSVYIIFIISGLSANLSFCIFPVTLSHNISTSFSEIPSRLKL